MQAAYQEVLPAARASLHLRVGRQLMAGLPRAQYEEQQYGILHHFNEAIHLITDPAERLKLVTANMAAGEAPLQAAQRERAQVFVRLWLIRPRVCTTCSYDELSRLKRRARQRLYPWRGVQLLNSALVIQTWQEVVELDCPC